MKHLNDTLEGAIIGAVGSVIGGFLAAIWTIHKQNLKDTGQKKREEITSARIIYSDLFTLIRVMIEMDKKFIHPSGAFAFNQNYSIHIAILGINFTDDEIFCLNKLYGIIIRLQKAILIDQLNSTIITMKCKEEYYSFVQSVYGNSENFINNTTNLNLENLDYFLITRNMIPRFKGIFDKIQKLKQ